MLTLSLLRHAKSAWDLAGQKDFDRPLAARGRRAAPAMGTYMAREGVRPDLVLASPAARTRETCALALAALEPRPEVHFEDALYLASPRTLLARIRKVSAQVRHLLVVGHNPGLHGLALELIAEGPDEVIAALEAKLPTAGLVTLELATATWAGAGPGTARLVRFVTPRMLGA